MGAGMGGTGIRGGGGPGPPPPTRRVLAAEPIQQQGRECLRLKVTVLGRGAQASPSPASTQKGGIQADDAAAQALRSVGQNAAVRGSSPFPLITLLLPLLVPGGL
eukprot:XP_015129650.2 ephrin-A1-like [Gallus gallus]